MIAVNGGPQLEWAIPHCLRDGGHHGDGPLDGAADADRPEAAGPGRAGRWAHAGWR
jgi:hypothetical protein